MSYYINNILSFIDDRATTLMESGGAGVLLLVLVAILLVLLLRFVLGFIFMIFRSIYRLLFGSKSSGMTAGDDSAMRSYEKGLSAERSGNIEKAIEYYDMAVMGGHGMASFRLASIYYGGTGKRRNPVMAIKYFRRAAMAGIPPAMDALAQAYQYGEGTVADPIKAYIWCLVAKAAGVRSAGERQLRYEAALLKDYSSGHLHSWRSEAALLFDQINRKTRTRQG